MEPFQFSNQKPLESLVFIIQSKSEYIRFMLTLTFLISLSVTLSAQWDQLGLDIDGEEEGDQSGQSVSLSSEGDIVAIGSIWSEGNESPTGQIRIYEYDGVSWVQLGGDIHGEAANDKFGHSVSLSSEGSRVAIGARDNNGNGGNSGHTRIYEFNGTTWVQLGEDIDGEEGGDESGYSVSLSSDGSRVAIGARFNDGNGYHSGHTRIYEFNGTSWVQLGMDIDGEEDRDESGYSVSLSSDGSRVAIGARRNSEFASGHTRVYEYDGTSWRQLGMDIDGEADFDNSGYAVSLSSDGNRVAIGAPLNDDSGIESGHARIYEYNGTSWEQLGLDIDGKQENEHFGRAVSLSSDGSRVAIGAYPNFGTSSDGGDTRIYEYNGSNWVQVGMDINGEAEEDRFGFSVSLSRHGSRVAIGAPWNDGNGSFSGHVRIFNYVAPCAFMPEVFGDTLLCPNDSGELSTQSFDSYQWYKRAYSDTVAEMIPGATSQSITVNAEEDGLYYFSVEVTEDTCTVRSEEVLVDAVMPEVSGDTLLCPNDSAELFTQTYDSYQWYKRAYSDTVTEMIPGATSQSITINAEDDGLYYFSVEVTKDTCRIRSDEVLVEVVMPEVFGDTLLCPNDSGELSTQPYDSYQWYKRAYSDTLSEMIPGATSQSITIHAEEDGLYFFSVEVTEDTCTARSEEVLVDVYSFLLPFVSSSGDFEIDPSDGSSVLCEGDTMYFTLLPPYDTSITWFKEGSPIPGENDTTLTVTMAGDYLVEGAPSVCPGFVQQLGVTLTVKVEDCTSHSEDPFRREIEVYPNPAKEQIHLHLNSLPYTIIDTKGEVLKNGRVEEQRIPIENLPTGLYILQVRDDQKVHQAMFVKE